MGSPEGRSALYAQFEIKKVPKPNTLKDIGGIAAAEHRPPSNTVSPVSEKAANVPFTPAETERSIKPRSQETILADMATVGPEKRPTIGEHKDIYRVQWDPETYKVHVDSDITPEEHRASPPESHRELFDEQCRRLEGKNIVSISSTVEGGGVAMMRGPLVDMAKGQGFNYDWFVMKPPEPDEPNVFEFTKKMHNISQRQAGDERITEEGKKIHQEWAAKNAEVLMKQDEIKNAHVIIIEDPQPSPLIPYIKELYPHIKIVFRNHIDTSRELMADPKTPQGEVADYILKENGVEKADAIIAHPVDNFQYKGLENKTYYIPAAIDLKDNLNCELTPEEVATGHEFINKHIDELNKTLPDNQHMRHINPDTPKIYQFARFDESKGIPHAIEAGVQTIRRLRGQGVPEDKLPQIVIAGNGAVDDPSGMKMLEKTLADRAKYPEELENITVVRLPHNYEAVNALMTPQKDATGNYIPIIAMQLSTAEGCETRITDSIIHGVPVVISNRGGMSAQIPDGKGLTLNFDRDDLDIPEAAEYMSNLIAKPDAYAEARQQTLEQAETYNKLEFVTSANFIRMFRVCANVLEGVPADKRWRITKDFNTPEAPTSGGNTSGGSGQSESTVFATGSAA